MALLIAVTGCEPQETQPRDDEETMVDETEVQAFQSDMQSRLDAAEDDIARVEQRETDNGEADNDGILTTNDNRAERLRERAADVRQRLEMPETGSRDQFASWREDVHGDVTRLEASIDAALIETSPDIASAESEARERLTDIRGLIQEVPDADERMNLEEQAAEVENNIAEATADPDAELEDVRSDLASSVENLRQSVADVDMYEDPQTTDETPVDVASDDDFAVGEEDGYDDDMVEE